VSWFKVDDGFHSHPKVLALPLDAIGLWTKCGAYCAQYAKLEGFVSLEVATALSGLGASKTKTLGDRLVKAGLWDVVDGGWRYHDWIDFNPTAEEVEQRRSKRAAAGRIGGQRSAEQRASKPEASCLEVASDVLKQSSTPSRPVPSRPVPIDPPIPPASDSNDDWGIEPERESAVQPIAETPSEQRYQAAYEAGAEAGLGRPFGLPEKQRGELHQAIAKHARDAEGRALRGEVLLDWIRWHAEEFTRWVSAKPADEQRFWSGFGPRGMFRWLNEVPVNQQPAPAQDRRRGAREPVAAGALFAPRGVGRG
jgi:hypothetical protein